MKVRSVILGWPSASLAYLRQHSSLGSKYLSHLLVIPWVPKLRRLAVALRASLTEPVIMVNLLISPPSCRTLIKYSCCLDLHLLEGVFFESGWIVVGLCQPGQILKAVKILEKEVLFLERKLKFLECPKNIIVKIAAIHFEIWRRELVLQEWERFGHIQELIRFRTSAGNQVRWVISLCGQRWGVWLGRILWNLESLVFWLRLMILLPIAVFLPAVDQTLLVV